MNTVQQLQSRIREQFPDISAKADREFIRYWGKSSPEDAYSWFQSLANALNAEMKRDVIHSVHEPLLVFMSNALADCDEEVFNCIDVSFVENLFWQVPVAKAEPYWQSMPGSLKELYIGFHSKPPL